MKIRVDDERITRPNVQGMAPTIECTQHRAASDHDAFGMTRGPGCKHDGSDVVGLDFARADLGGRCAGPRRIAESFKRTRL